MTATYTHNQVGKPTALQKDHHSEEEKEKCKWFKTQSSHRSMANGSNKPAASHTYNNAGRLTQVQNTPAGKDCTTRVHRQRHQPHKPHHTPCPHRKMRHRRRQISTQSYDRPAGRRLQHLRRRRRLPANDAEEAGEHVPDPHLCTDLASQNKTNKPSATTSSSAALSKPSPPANPTTTPSSPTPPPQQRPRMDHQPGL